MLHCDIIFIKGRPRLFTVDHVSGYCTFNVMDGKSVRNVAFDDVINAYTRYLKVVRYISCDAESVLGACKDHLLKKGVILVQKIPGEHEKYAERSTRVVRERTRVKIQDLEYTLPNALYDYLVSDIIRNMNMLPNSKSKPLIPRDMVCGQSRHRSTFRSSSIMSCSLCNSLIRTETRIRCVYGTINQYTWRSASVYQVYTSSQSTSYKTYL